MREMYNPHPKSAFDGAYTRISCEQGSFCMIMASVPDAKGSQPCLVHVAFYPAPTASKDDQALSFEVPFYPPVINLEERGDMTYTLSAKHDNENEFTFSVEQHRQHYSMSFTLPTSGQHVSLEVDLTERTPHSLLGPMWIARYMPLPLKWHVFSLASVASVRLSTPSQTLSTTGRAHMEKNWGNGFPEAWIWAQAFTKGPGGSVVVAGGRVLPGLRSTMISVRTPSGRLWDFGPSSTMQLFGYGPACTVAQNSRAGTVSLTAVDYLRGRKLFLDISAPADTFRSMAAPLPEGHVETFATSLSRQPMLLVWRSGTGVVAGQP